MHERNVHTHTQAGGHTEIGLKRGGAREWKSERVEERESGGAREWRSERVEEVCVDPPHEGAVTPYTLPPLCRFFLASSLRSHLRRWMRSEVRVEDFGLTYQRLDIPLA